MIVFPMLQPHLNQLLLLATMASLAVVMLFESAAPLRRNRASRFRRWPGNLVLTMIEHLLALVLLPALTIMIAGVHDWHATGLIARTGLGPLGGFVLTLLALQCLGYWLHRAFHRIGWMWRIHSVHHSDPEVDATTVHRHHPLEVMIGFIVALPLIFVLGPTPLQLLAYNIIHIAVATFSHGNLTLGKRMDAWVRPVLVTPSFHRLHHAAARPYTDSNYATLLPLFDHLFGTVSRLPEQTQATMTLGLEYFRSRRYAGILALLRQPFLPNFGSRRKHP